MLKSYGWGGWVRWWVVAPKIIESAPVPFGPLWAPFRAGTGLDWVGIGSGGIGDSWVGARA